MGNDTRRERTGSVRQLASGRWQVRVSCGYREDGHRRTICETYETEHEARRRAWELSAQMGRDKSLARGRRLADIWAMYLAEREGKLAGTTMDAYRWQMDAVILPVLGEMDVSKISHAQIQRLLLTQRRSVAQKTRTTLSSVLSWAVKRGLLGENVMRRANFELPHESAPSDFDADPFAAIEGSRDVWDVRTVLACLELIRGLPLEPAWLACVGGGLRVEEALALRRPDVRRVEVGGRMVTQLAVHAAATRMDARKATKTARSVRIVTMLEPFGARYWELVEQIADDTTPICPVSPTSQNKRWRSYFQPPREYHARMAESRKVRGKLCGLPYVPLSKMRATHATMMQEAGVLDSLNAAMHGHSEQVSRRHYLHGDGAQAVQQVERHFSLVS